MRAEEAQKRKDALKSGGQATITGEEQDIEGEDMIYEGEEEDDEDDLDDMDADNDSANPMAALLASAQARAAEYQGGGDDDDYDEMDEDDDDTSGGVQLPSGSYTTDTLLKAETSRRAFDKVFKQVLEASDIILYVLDARDPLGTRSQEVERQVMASASGSKRLILILNKIDLIPAPVLKGWLIHLRRYFPTLPLRASSPASNAHTFNHKALTPQRTSATLFKALKSFSHNSGLNRAISVGVIGYPNVGKSSVINALTSRLSRNGSTACPTGSEAGITTSLRTVKLDSKLSLLDSPGIVFPSQTSTDSSSSVPEDRATYLSRLALLSALPPKQISDPVPAITLLLNRLSTNPPLLNALCQQYHLAPLVPSREKEGDITTDFLVQVARKRGRLGKGGVPNVQAAAMQVLGDWRDGRIRGWVEPPTIELDTSLNNSNNNTEPGKTEDEATGPAKTKDNIQIVKQWSQEFKLEGLWGDGGNEDIE